MSRRGEKQWLSQYRNDSVSPSEREMSTVNATAMFTLHASTIGLRFYINNKIGCFIYVLCSGIARNSGPCALNLLGPPSKSCFRDDAISKSCSGMMQSQSHTRGQLEWIIHNYYERFKGSLLLKKETQWIKNQGCKLLNRIKMHTLLLFCLNIIV